MLRQVRRVCTSHSVDGPDGKTVDSFIKSKSADIVGEILPEESSFEPEQNPRYSRAAGSDVYMHVEDPTDAAAAAAAPTAESAYLQIGESSAGVQKQNPLFVEETGFGFGEDE